MSGMCQYIYEIICTLSRRDDGLIQYNLPIIDYFMFLHEWLC